MDPEIYLAFAKQEGHDLATRRNSKGQKLARGLRRQERFGGGKQRIVLRGDHIAYQDDPKHPLNREPYLRGSDSVLRLTHIIAALEKHHEAVTGKTKGANHQACRAFAAYLLTAPWLPLRSLFLRGKRGPKARQSHTPVVGPESPSARTLHETRDPRFAELDAQIEADRRRARLSPPVTLKRLANSIRNQVREWRKKHPDHEATFNMRFGAFRFSHWRDADWYMRTERSWHQALARCQQDPDLGPHDYMVGRYSLALGRLCHEQLRYEEAARWYGRAWSVWLGVPNLSPQYRSWLLNAAAVGLGRSSEKLSLLPDSPYRGTGPRLVVGLVGSARISIPAIMQ